MDELSQTRIIWVPTPTNDDTVMNPVHPLAKELKTVFPWHQARILLIAQFILAVIQLRTTNLAKLAYAFHGQAVADSNYRRLRRFLSEFTIDYELCAKVIASRFCPEDSWILSVDRTNWNFGKTKINFLVLGVSHQGIAIPLFWKILNKKGNSNTQERIALMDRFLTVFSHQKIRCLTGDREFIGQEWFEYLKGKDIPFAMRIKKNLLTHTKHGRPIKVSRLFNLQVGEEMVLNKPRKICGAVVYLACVMSPKERVIIACFKHPHQAIAHYRERWGIETLFGCLKTRGFDLEATHLRDSERLERLFFILALTAAWCVTTGLWLHNIKAIKVKKHGRKAISFFRYGLDKLHASIMKICYADRDYYTLLSFLSGT